LTLFQSNLSAIVDPFYRESVSYWNTVLSHKPLTRMLYVRLYV